MIFSSRAVGEFCASTKRAGKCLRGRAVRLGLACLVAAAALAGAPAAARADDSGVVAHLRDSLYLPEGMALNTLSPAGTYAGLGGVYTVPADDVALLSTSPLPEKFDLRDVDGTSYVTPVKNQGPWGACWAFAPVSALESNLLMQGVGSADPAAPNYMDLSELFVAGFGRTAIPAETLARIGASTQLGEGMLPSARSVYLNTGGYEMDAATWIMSMGGVPAEKTAPYQDDNATLMMWEDPVLGITMSCYSPEEPWTLAEALRADRSNRVATVESVQELPGPYGNSYDAEGNVVLGEYSQSLTELMKRAIMTGGSVAIGYFEASHLLGSEWQGEQYFNLENWSQYAYDAHGFNHVVSVVGWDDTYSRENFSVEPEGDGAWIVKNSYGSVEGEGGNYSSWGVDGSGYFYLSYYDKTIFSACAVTAETECDTDRIIQQYDLLNANGMMIDSVLSTDEALVANVFTADEDMIVESVTAYAGLAGMNVETEVYLLGDEADEPDDGVLVSEQSDEFPLLGYYTIDLDEPVPVQAGQRYAVVQTLSGYMDDGAGSDLPVWGIPVERGITREYADEVGVAFYADAVANEGESYVALDGEWCDATELNDDLALTEDGAVVFGNVEIKVFASAAELPDDGSLSVVHTNDTHGRYSVSDASGQALNAYGAVAALAERVGADLILDAGDTFHGSSFATASKGSAIAQLMDAAGYDATTPGNHDWSYGASRLTELDQNSSFSVLAANVANAATGEAYFDTPYLLREVALADDEGNLTGRSVTVGVLGVIDEDFYNSTAPSNVAGVAFSDSVEAANEVAAELRAAGAEVVVALTHNEDPQAFAKATKGIDAVVAGHEHVAVDETVESADGRSVAVVEVPSSPSADYFERIGVLTIDLEALEDEGTSAKATGTRNSSAGRFVVQGHTSQTVSTADEAKPNEAIDALTKRLVEQNDAALAEVVGHSDKAYEYAPSTASAPGGWELVRTQDTPIGHVVTSAYLAQTGADLAFENAGGIRGGIPAGDVTAGDVLAVSPYGNTLATYKMTGAQVLDAIERSLSLSADCREVLAKQMAAVQAGEDPMQYQWPKNSGSVLAVGGATMKVDWGKPDGKRVVEITVGGERLDADRVYTVALNSYLPGATDTYPSLAKAKLVHEYGTCEEALRAFIAQSDWEQVVGRALGSVEYVGGGDLNPGGGSDSGGDGSRPDAERPDSNTPSGGAHGGSGGGLAATGDFAGIAVVFGAAGAVLIAAGFFARRSRRR